MRVIVNTSSLIAAIGLLLLTALPYLQVASFGFVDLDDDVYVVHNRFIQQGVNSDSLKWALTATINSNWHPLTWMSHMLDWQCFGGWAGGAHLVNLAFHLINTLLVFLLLRALTGRLWPSALVAALFGIHPLHVESVAWVSERKDVLSAFFGLATLLAYARYVCRRGGVRCPASGVQDNPSACHPPPPRHRGGYEEASSTTLSIVLWYLVSLLLFAHGLASKPMLVTLPAVMLLLDIWPLARWCPGDSWRRAGWLVLEKLPFFALSAALAWVTYRVQSGEAVVPCAALPVGVRVANAVLACAAYLRDAVLPVNLAAFYPYVVDVGIPWGAVMSAALLLLAITVVSLWQLRARPWLAVGWFCFIGMLVPVIGLVQVGEQARADRYTYLPLLGVFIMLVWSGLELVDRAVGRSVAADGTVMQRVGGRPRHVWMVVALLLGVLLALTWRQVATWRSPATLWQHALDVTERNYRAHMGLGQAWTDQGRYVEAMAQYQAAMAIDPQHPAIHKGLGVLLAKMGRYDDAIVHLRRSLVPGQSDEAEVCQNLGSAYFQAGKLSDAAVWLDRTARLNPYNADARSLLGVCFARQGDLPRAVALWREALRIDPQHTASLNNLRRAGVAPAAGKGL
ncbi:MAG: tetratricopeptide repeat protein [Kiritimatiellia bacterium]